MKRKGFTLSEVLITLGVIGVVAALTLPPLIQNYQKQVTVNKLKKFYTEMNQILQMARNDHGDFSTWTFSRHTDFYTSYIKPYIKKVDKVQTQIHISNVFADGYRIVFADGTQMFISTGSNPAGHGNVAVVFDLHAHKHVDIYGNDIKHPTRERFYFVVNNKGILVPQNWEDRLPRKDYVYHCKRKYDGTNNGNLTCAALIMLDGWKIKDDYPW